MSTTSIQNVLYYLKEQQSSVDICDMVIHCNNGQVNCHSILFAAISPFWRKLLTSAFPTESFHVFISEVDINYVKNIFSIVYDGNVILQKGEKVNFKTAFKCIFPDLDVNTGRLKNSINHFQQQVEVKKLMNPRTCEFCFKYFARKEICQQHMKTVHESSTIVCNICSGRFKSKSALDKHVDLKHSEETPKKYSCPSCAKLFAYESGLKRHIKFENHQYPTANSSMKVREGFKSCSICGNIVGRMEYHMKRYHQDDSQIFYCKKCEKKFNRKDTLHKHEENVHSTFNINFPAVNLLLKVKNDNWKCKMCGKIFNSSFELNDHLISNTCSDCDKENLKCEYCKKTYKTKII